GARAARRGRGRPAKRKALQHPAPIRSRALVARLPEAEAPEPHPDPLPALRDAVPPPVEVEVLECGQLAVDERLVRQVADLPSKRIDLQLTGGRHEQAGDESQQGRLAGAVGAGDDEEASPLELEVDRLQGALVVEAPRHPTNTN